MAGPFGAVGRNGATGATGSRNSIVQPNGQPPSPPSDCSGPVGKEACFVGC